jgi:hypothetical protein
MSLVWKKMIGRRHAVVNGTAICGVRSIEEVGEALPCETCLDAVNKASKSAFAD